MDQSETDGRMFRISNSAGAAAGTAARGMAASPMKRGAAALAGRGRDMNWLKACLWAGKAWIILLAILGAALAALVSLAIPPRYQATAQMIIDPRELRVLQNEVTPGAVGSDSTTAYAESQARVMASDSVKMRLIENEQLDRDPEFGNAGPEGGLFGFLRGFGLASTPRTAADPMLTALRALEKKIQVRRGERTFVIDITATSEDPKKAARLANGLANAYLDDQSAVRSDTAKRTTTALSGRLVELRQKLREAEEKAEMFKAQKDIVGVAGKLVNDEQLSLLNAQLQQLRAKTVEARAKYEQVRRLKASSLESASLPEAVASNTVTALRAQLGAALNREAELLAALGPRHPALGAARTQVQDSRRQIADELQRIGQAARVEMDRTQAAEKALLAQVDALKRDQVGASRAFVDLRELEREVESSRAIYETFLRRARETAEQVGVDTTNARIISEAIPPENKSGTSGKAIVALGGILGMGLGVAMALGRGLMADAPRNGNEARAGSVRPPHTVGAAETTGAAADRDPAPSGPPSAASSPSPEPSALLERLRQVPLLASLPKAGGLGWKRGRAELASVFQGKGFIVDSYEDGGSRFAQAIRQLRAAIAGSAGSAGNRKILITALRPGLGCSTVALNLALASANEGRTPLLVDAGRGQGSLTAKLADDATLGFDDVLSGAAGMVRAALQDEETGVFFLPRLEPEAVVGRTASLDAAALGERFFPAARRFDCVIVDGSVLGADQMTQAFCEAVDDIILVVESQTALRSDLSDIVAALGANTAKLRGFVVNRA